MRVILFLTIGFALACALGAYVLDSSALLILCLVAMVVGLLCLLLRKRTAKIICLVLAGAAFGFLWMHLYDDFYLAQLHSFDGETVTTTVTISDYSDDTYYGISADGKIRLEGKTYRIRLYVNDLQELSPGDRLTGQIELRATTAGGAAESDYYMGKGVFLVGYVSDGAAYEKAEKLAFQYYPAIFRAGALEILESCFPADTLAFARALLLGETDQITYEQDTAYKISGIRHVVAVSGLHVSILFSLVYMAAGKRRFLTALLGIPVLILFAAVAGFTPSVVRACTMQCLMILALLLNKDYDPPTALATAVLLILLCNPMMVTSVSLQLSVGSMAGIFLFCKKLHGYFSSGKLGEISKGKGLLSNLARWCLTSISVTLSAMTLTTPLCACYFGSVSLVGIFTNLLCLWLISGIFYGIMVSCLLGIIWLPAGQVAAGFVSICIRFVQGLSGFLSGLPFAAVYTDSPYIVVWLILSYCLLALFLLAKKKKPLFLALSIALSLLLAIGATCLEPILGNYLVTVIDVGQGQCVLLRCDKKYYLVDCGGEHGTAAADKAASLLLSQGIVALEGIILTHYDADHANGVEYLMQRIPTRQLYLPDAPDENTRFREELTQAYENKIIWINGDVQFGQRDWRITIFAGEPGKVGNESSLGVLFQRQNCDILITGDRSTRMEAQIMERWELPKLELLVVGHHGSQSSTGLPLLAQTQPDYAAISVGKDNLYGHPADETLKRLELAQCVILRTDRDGDINFRR
ncbi:MAG: DNA internalization-related competence protein ComEC/Rec2 [Oscillospiraceae bacterium]|nr:DNA internalization-related competence protein ComEC/Rec2 [Oscillospiraceae bacterium]